MRLKERLRRFEGLNREPVSLGKMRSLILPEPGQAHPFFELAFAVILQGGNRSPGKAHSPPLAGLGARANYPAAPVLSAGEGASYVQGGLNGVEVHVFPTQRQ